MLHECSLQRTYIAQTRIYDAVHLGNPPLHYVAQALVVDIKVLPAHRTLCPFFEFVLTVATTNGPGFLVNSDRVRRRKSSRLYQAIFFQGRHELVELFDLQPNPSRQVVILEAG